MCVCCNTGSAQQALQTPQTMLDEVVWCVSDSPQQARLDTLHAAVPFAHVQAARYGACTLYAHMPSVIMHMLMSAYLRMVVTYADASLPRLFLHSELVSLPLCCEVYLITACWPLAPITVFDWM